MANVAVEIARILLEFEVETVREQKAAGLNNGTNPTNKNGVIDSAAKHNPITPQKHASDKATSTGNLS